MDDAAIDPDKAMEMNIMNRSIVGGVALAGACMLAAGPLFAAQVIATDTPDTSTPAAIAAAAPSPTVAPAATCLNDLRAFDTTMNKDGYWPGGAGFGYGYQMDGYSGMTPTGYRNIRPSYELRILVTSANILARHGQQQTCEDVLSTARGVYKTYVADMHGGGATADAPSRQQIAITASEPVTLATTPMRSDELLGTDVRNMKNEALGSIHDIILSPQTGKIAYLVIGSGGFFGIDENYIPVPWADFKETKTMSLLVLDTTKRAMDDAPQVKKDFSGADHFDQEGPKVDSYWKAHLASN
jgi:sporulation protein YlmC with PRC-barrel domain